MNKPRFSVIIPTYQRPEILKSTLQGLSAQSCLDFEVIIVQDGVGDSTKKVIELLKPSLNFPVIFLEQTHRGPAAARNKGIAAATGEYVLFIGDDMIPDKECIKEHYECQVKNKACAVLGYVAWSKDVTVTPFMQFIAPQGPQFTFSAIRDYQNVPYTFFYTANISLSRKIAEDNLFDEAFVHAAVEDIELGYRLQKQGVRTVYCPKAVVFHHHEMLLEQFLKRNDAVVEGYAILFRKHPELKQIIVPKCVALKCLFFKMGVFMLAAVGAKQSRYFFKCITSYDLLSKLKRIV